MNSLVVIIPIMYVISGVATYRVLKKKRIWIDDFYYDPDEIADNIGCVFGGIFWPYTVLHFAIIKPFFKTIYKCTDWLVDLFEGEK